MLNLIVVPTGEEQAKISQGIDPDVSNVFTREFSSAQERDSYIKGLEALADLVEYEILSETSTSVTVVIDGEKTNHVFDNEIDKAAYVEGLSDGDGWNSPLVIKEDENTELFDRLSALIDAAAPKI